MKKGLITLPLLLGALNVYEPDANASVKPPAIDDKELHCLARVIYHEARGEPQDGKLAVARVTLNRVKHGEFPDSVCEVIAQRNAYPWHSKLRTPTKSKHFHNAKELARFVLRMEHYGMVWSPEPIRHATFFNTVPFKMSRLKYVGKIGGHLFYELK